MIFDFSYICFLALLCRFAFGHPPDVNFVISGKRLNSRTILRPRVDPPPRIVTVISDVRTNVHSPTGEQLFPIHSAIDFAGNDQDGPMRVEIVIDNNERNKGNLALRALDLTTFNSGRTISRQGPPDTVRHLQEIGQTRLTNSEIADLRTGKGLVADTWALDNVWRTGPANLPVNTCSTFIRRLVRALDLEFEGEMVNIFARDDEYFQTYARSQTHQIDYLLRETLSSPKDRKEWNHWRIAYDISNPRQPTRDFDNEPYRLRNPNYPVVPPGLSEPPPPIINPFLVGPRPPSGGPPRL